MAVQDVDKKISLSALAIGINLGAKLGPRVPLPERAEPLQKAAPGPAKLVREPRRWKLQETSGVELAESFLMRFYRNVGKPSILRSTLVPGPSAEMLKGHFLYQNKLDKSIK